MCARICRQFFPLVYLGVLIVKGWVSSSLFDGIVAKLRARNFHWSTKLLSMGRKLILFKYVLNSMPLYLFQVLKLSKVVIMALERMFNAFLWDKTNDDSRIH